MLLRSPRDHRTAHRARVDAAEFAPEERLVRLVPQLMAERASLDAFRAWFRTLADFVRLKQGLGASPRALRRREEWQSHR
jgi:hypothetical protein